MLIRHTATDLNAHAATAQDVLKRIGAQYDFDGKLQFTGWARMGLPTVSHQVVEVKKPKVGELRPAAVTAEVVITIKGLRGDVASEWDQLKQHDVIFLLTGRVW